MFRFSEYLVSFRKSFLPKTMEIIISQVITYLNEEIYFSIEGFYVVVLCNQFLLVESFSFLEVE